jgi:hypothetical protein
LPGKAELQLEGYELFLSESTSPSKRGAALYVNKKLKAEEIRFNMKFEESEWTERYDQFFQSILGKLKSYITMICENFLSFDTMVNSLFSSSRFSGLLLGLLYMQPSNNISLLFSLIEYRMEK